MSFDEILDFLFHRIAGIIFMIAGSVERSSCATDGRIRKFE